MPDQQPTRVAYHPQLGCVLLVLLLFTFCLLPGIAVDVMRTILAKLHLDPVLAPTVLLGMLLGGMINIPIHRFEREAEQPLPDHPLYRVLGWSPMSRRHVTETILAVNVGGCVIPLGMAAYELSWLLSENRWVITALAAATMANVLICHASARPLPGVGIAMPAFVSPITAVLAAWLLLWNDAYDDVRAPVAFIAGVAGPLIGADLLNLRRFARLSAGVISIGGAGTFDGIVISGMLAALLA
jgi:uncharacterized membrane protein